MSDKLRDAVETLLRDVEASKRRGTWDAERKALAVRALILTELVKAERTEQP